MKLVNETNVPVNYFITSEGAGDCGTIPVNGLVDLPFYDGQQNVTVEFLPAGRASFLTSWDTTQTDQETRLTLVAL